MAQVQSTALSAIGFAAPARSRVQSAAAQSPDSAALSLGPGAIVAWWLLQGIALGTAGGLAVSTLVIALCLALRQMLGAG